MLDADRNRMLMEVGAGTPMGEVMRRYWHPVAAVSQMNDKYTMKVRLLGEDLVEEDRDLVGIAVGNARRLQHLVDAILDVERLRSGAVALDARPLDVAALAEAVVRGAGYGLAKAGVNSLTQQLAHELGGQNIRVNAISAGPIKTLAAAGINDFRYMLKWTEHNAPLRRVVTVEEVGDTAVYFLSDLSRAVTGEVHHVDAGYNIVGLPYLTGEEAE